MNSLSSFKQADIIIRILPASILLLFFAIEFLDQLVNKYRLSIAEIFILIAVVSYPLGLSLEESIISLKGMVLRKTKYSDDAQIMKYLGYDIWEFWSEYIKFYSEPKQELIKTIERYSLLQAFFLNLAIVAIIALCANILIGREIFTIFNFSLLISLILFLRLHIQNKQYYFYVFARATNDKKSWWARARTIVPPPPELPEPPEMLIRVKKRSPTRGSK
jgi:hypothetical protein